MKIKLANRLKGMNGGSMIDLLKATQIPGMISFAGGFPAPELFPAAEMAEVSQKVLKELPHLALQYSATEGYLPLRKHFADRMESKVNKKVSSDEILITAGSQQGLDFVAKALINPGDTIICESPTYLGAINAFRAYEPNFIEIPTDEHGMRLSVLEKILASEKNIKFIYINPDFQNPGGRSWSIDRRRKLVELIEKHDVPVVEDNPYGELYFEGKELPTIKSMDKNNHVIFLGTLSKILCPGYRLGWIYASKDFIKIFNTLKQAADLQCSTISQVEVSAYFDTYDIETHISSMKKVYSHRKNVMIKAMEKYFPEDVTYTNPKGGLFTWVTLPDGLNASCLQREKAIPKGVAFVPGEAFYPSGEIKNNFRLNFSCMSEEKIIEGIQLLGEAIKEYIKEK